jgi:1-acyl-sn-glycerol-3-phosphate acyltransferase
LVTSFFKEMVDPNFRGPISYRGFNELNIEGSEIRNLPELMLFISNHQTYFADVVAMFHVFNAS